MRLVGNFSGARYLSSATRPEMVWLFTPGLEVPITNPDNSLGLLSVAWHWPVSG